MPSWTPDGRRVVFHARHAPEKANLLPTRKIWVVDRDGKNAHKLSDGPADEYHPVVSPDGTKIAFVSEANGSRDVWVMDADGKNALSLTDDPGLEEHPCWSPDGKQIAYVALPKDGGSFDLWMMNADGSGKRKLTSYRRQRGIPRMAAVGPGDRLRHRPERQLRHLRSVDRRREDVPDRDGTAERHAPGLVARRHQARVHALARGRSQHAGDAVGRERRRQRADRALDPRPGRPSRVELRTA